MTAAHGVVDVDEPCVVRESGTVACWVDYGLREPVPNLPTLYDIAGVTDVTHVASGANHACALTHGGQVACWGWAAAGRLGDGSLTLFTSPEVITGD